MKIRDIMTTEVITLQVDDELSLASDIMNLARIRHLPIVEGDRLMGIVSQRDLFKASLASVMGYDYSETRDHLKTVSIREAMVSEVITVDPDTLGFHVFIQEPVILPGGLCLRNTGF